MKLNNQQEEEINLRYKKAPIKGHFLHYNQVSAEGMY